MLDHTGMKVARLQQVAQQELIYQNYRVVSNIQIMEEINDYSLSAIYDKLKIIIAANI